MRWRSLGLGLVVVACHREASAPVAKPVAAPAAPASSRPGVRGEVVAPDGMKATGRLALTWWTVAEDKEGLTLTTLRKMIDRMTVSPAEIDLGKTPRIPYELPAAPDDAVPVAIFDIDHTFWDTLLGHGKGLRGTGTSGGGTLSLAASKTSSEPKPERCAGERYKLLVIEDAVLGKRRFCAYLPESWKTSPKRRYPLVMLLPGFGSNEMSYLGGEHHGGERADALAKELGREVVLVGVDTSVPLGSTYLEDSAPMGPWDTFLAKKALPVLDRELHVLPKRTAHALMGQSTGGYNSLSFGMRHSDLFSAIGSSSPDAPDVGKWLLVPGTRRANEWMRNWEKIEIEVGGAGQFTSWAASWSPDTAAPRGFRFPVDPQTGLVDDGVLAQWDAKTPHGLVRDPKFLARTKADLSGRIMIIVGKKDDFDLFAPAESFAKELNSLGVETRFVATESGHAGYLEERFEPSLRFVLERLDTAK